MEPTPDTGPPIQQRPYAAGEAHEIVALLNRAFGSWGDEAQWNWKHADRPGFKDSDVLLYAVDGTVVACLHMIVNPLNLEPGLTMPYSIEGDLAVDPRYRRSGLMLRAHDEAKRREQEQGVVLRLGFALRSMHDRIYRQAFGHTAVPDGTVRYRKILSTRQLCRSLEGVGRQLAVGRAGRRVLARGPLTVQLHITGFSPCLLVLAADSAHCTPELSAACDVRLTAPYAQLAGLRGPRGSVALKLARGLVTRELKVQGGWVLLGRWLLGR